MAAKSTENVPQKRRHVNARKRKPGDDRVARDNVVYLGQQPTDALPTKSPRRAPKNAKAIFCASCKLSHAQGDAHNRIGIVVVAGELGVEVETVKKYVTRARAGKKQFPLPVTPAKARMFFDACAIARHKHQGTARTDRAVLLEERRVRAEHEATIRCAAVENANLDVQIERLALEIAIVAKKAHRRRLKEFLRELSDDETTFRAHMRLLEEELNQDLSDGAR